MNTFNEVWRKLAKSKKYREEFVAAQLKRGIPFQARALLKSRKWSQEVLAEKANLTQGVVSRALNPDYGNLTLNTIIRVAAGFDVAFVGKFVPFSALTEWFSTLSEESMRLPSFEEEQLVSVGEGEERQLSKTQVTTGNEPILKALEPPPQSQTAGKANGKVIPIDTAKRQPPLPGGAVQTASRLAKSESSEEIRGAFVAASGG